MESQIDTRGPENQPTCEEQPCKSNAGHRWSTGSLLSSVALGSFATSWMVRCYGRRILACSIAGGFTIVRISGYSEAPRSSSRIQSVSNVNSGILTSYELNLGKRVFRQRVKGGNTTAYTSSPIASHDNLYCTSEEGHTFIIAMNEAGTIVAQNDKSEPRIQTLYLSGMGSTSEQSNVVMRPVNDRQHSITLQDFSVSR